MIRRILLALFDRIWNWLSDHIPELGDFDEENE